MPFVRQRTTKAGTLSTALVEAYRDEQGRPRQRLLANLHGEPTLLRALAKLTVTLGVLSRELDELIAEHGKANDPMRRGDLAGRILRIDKQLKAIAKDGDAINQHCTATPEEIEAAIEAHERECKHVFHEVLGRGFAHALELKVAKATLRRLTT